MNTAWVKSTALDRVDDQHDQGLILNLCETVPELLDKVSQQALSEARKEFDDEYSVLGAVVALLWTYDYSEKNLSSIAESCITYRKQLNVRRRARQVLEQFLAI